MISTKDLEIHLNTKGILKNITYDFEKGRIYGIIGPNGAGKSTYLKAISGFIAPTSGQIYFRGKLLDKPQKKIAIVWQKPYMFQTTVYQNVAYGLRIRHINRKKVEQKVIEILQLFQIEHLKDQHASQLSGGETAKVAIARAVATSPEVLILDEPTASIDPQSVIEIEKIIVDLKQKYQMTIILVTHNMFQAKRVADETLFFHSGQLIEANETKILFTNPNNQLTYKFVNGEVTF